MSPHSIWCTSLTACPIEPCPVYCQCTILRAPALARGCQRRNQYYGRRTLWDQHRGVHGACFVNICECLSLQTADSGEIYSLCIGGGTHSDSTRIRRADDGYCNAVQRITNGCVPAPSVLTAAFGRGASLRWMPSWGVYYLIPTDTLNEHRVPRTHGRRIRVSSSQVAQSSRTPRGRIGNASMRPGEQFTVRRSKI